MLKFSSKDVEIFKLFYLLQTTISFQNVNTTIRIVEYLIQIIKDFIRDRVRFNRILEKAKNQMLYNIIINSDLHIRLLRHVDRESVRVLFNLFDMTDNQSSMMRSLSSVKTDESDNFLNVTIDTSLSVIDKNVFEFQELFSRSLSRSSTFNSRMMSFVSFSSSSRSLYFSMNSSNFITFLLYSLMTKMLSSRISIYALIKAFSSFFNQYLN